MKRMLYLNLNFKYYRNKTLAQMKTFINHGFIADLMMYEDGRLKIYSFNGKELKLTNEIIIKSNISKKRSFYKEMSHYICEFLNREMYTLMYIRRLYLPIVYFNFESMRKSTKIVYEIPTYPFDKLKNKKAGVKQTLEAIYLKLGGYKKFDLIVTMLQNRTKIFPNMQPVSNGIDIEKYDITKRLVRKKKVNELRLTGIAQLCYWHGYDRIVRAIEHEKSIDVQFTIYSPKTDEAYAIEKYVKEHNIADKVRIIEYTSDMDIVSEINQYDLAIGGIGYFRRNALYDTSLKNKEYCALGIPFVTASIDQSFPTDFKYKKMIEDNDQEVNLCELNDWYESIKTDNFVDYMNSYAKKNLTFDTAIDKVIQRLGL